MAQFQSKLGLFGFGHSPALFFFFFSQPMTPFGNSRVKFPCLFLSFDYFAFSLEKLK